MKFTKDQNKALQSALKTMKLYGGKIDGIPGPLTIAALNGYLEQYDDVEPDRPNDPPIIKDSLAPKIVVVPGVKYKSPGKFKTPSGKAKGLVVHYTVSARSASSAIGVVKYLASKGLGCPVMDEDGVIYIPEGFNLLTDIAYHAGASAWKGKTAISAYCIGMEICNWGSAGKSKKVTDLRTVKKKDNMFAGTYQKYTAAQEAALENFILWLSRQSTDFDIAWVVGHDEIATPLGRKNDPGGSLSMSMPEFRSKMSGLLGSGKIAA